MGDMIFQDTSTRALSGIAADHPVPSHGILIGIAGFVRSPVVDLPVLRPMDVGRPCQFGCKQLVQAMVGEEIPGGLLKIQEPDHHTGRKALGRFSRVLHKHQVIGIVEGIDQIPQPGHHFPGQLACRDFVPLGGKILRHRLGRVHILPDGQRRLFLHHFRGLGAALRLGTADGVWPAVQPASSRQSASIRLNRRWFLMGSSPFRRGAACTPLPPLYQGQRELQSLFTTAKKPGETAPGFGLYGDYSSDRIRAARLRASALTRSSSMRVRTPSRNTTSPSIMLRQMSDAAAA